MDQPRLLIGGRIGLCLVLLACSSACLAAVVDGPVQGFALDMPLGLVARQIVPADLALVYGRGVDQQLPTSWRGGASWQAALRDALAPLGLAVTFEDRRVSIDAPPAAGAVPVAADAAPILPRWLQPGRWEASPGEALADVVRRWSAEVGVHAVVHGIYRYPLEARLVFEEDFQSAVSHLVESFSTAEPKPILHIWVDGENYAIELVQGAAQ